MRAVVLSLVLAIAVIAGPSSSSSSARQDCRTVSVTSTHETRVIPGRLPRTEQTRHVVRRLEQCRNRTRETITRYDWVTVPRGLPGVR